MTTSELELKPLMLASLNGDAASHRRLLDRLSRHLRAYYKRKLAQLGRSLDEAEDLVQESLLAIHLKRHTYDTESLLTPWVHAIARYKLIDYLRRSRVSGSELPIEAADEVTAFDDHVAAESTYDISRLLAQLPIKARQAIEGVKLEGKTVAETAARYGMSESGVKINIHRGLKVLAALIRRESGA
jgi:RNA polymerase sigma-70 factor (ECF subfamily)